MQYIKGSFKMGPNDVAIRKEIVGEIERFVREDSSNRMELDGLPIYDAPLVGFVSGKDPLFKELKTVIGDFHQTPFEAMKKSAELRDIKAPHEDSIGVIAYILPMAKETIKENASMVDRPSQRWVHGRFYGERFQKEISDNLISFLHQRGRIACSPEQEASFFRKMVDPRVGYTSNWSLRHIAYGAGLGTFGLSDGLITNAGIAEAIGSVVVDLSFDNAIREGDIHANCLYFQSGKCMACVKRCPVGAISEHGHDKNKCAKFAFSQTRLNKERYGLEIYSCGLCFTNVPCAAKNPVETGDFTP